MYEYIYIAVLHLGTQIEDPQGPSVAKSRFQENPLSKTVMNDHITGSDSSEEVKGQTTSPKEQVKYKKNK